MSKVVKKHTTVTITRAMLQKLDACSRGLKMWADLLPAKLSTDPEENIDLAVTIASRNRDVDNTWSDVYWLDGSVNKSRLGFWPDSYNFDNPTGNPEHDAFVVAQWLAMIADALASRKGR